jgi:serralysin
VTKNVDFAADKFDLAAAVTGIDADIDAGKLRNSAAHFDGDLAAAEDAAHLAAHHAVLFTPDSGNLAGKTHLIVDVNGVAGYQSGANVVFQFVNPVNLASLGTEDFI